MEHYHNKHTYGFEMSGTAMSRAAGNQPIVSNAIKARHLKRSRAFLRQRNKRVSPTTDNLKAPTVSEQRVYPKTKMRWLKLGVVPSIHANGVNGSIKGTFLLATTARVNNAGMFTRFKTVGPRMTYGKKVPDRARDCLPAGNTTL